LSSDEGGEFRFSELTIFLQSKGIQIQGGPADTPQFNSIQERGNRTIGEMADALLFQSGLARFFWPLARQAAVYLLNKCPRRSNPNGITPYEVFMVHFQIFHIYGSLVALAMLIFNVNTDKSYNPNVFKEHLLGMMNLEDV
jgi:hypothetical protein